MIGGGCASGGSSRAVSSGDAGQYVAELQADCHPPSGWTLKPRDPEDRAEHCVWVSPTGLTAYGVMRVALPLPVGERITLWGFMNEMRRREGEGRLVSHESDPGTGELRFVAEGGRYRTRGRIRTRGLTAWVAYAGTLLAQPESAEELQLAEDARDRTRFSKSRRD